MNWEIVEAISALIASIATLLTLIYLAIQIRDSNRLARSASLQSVIESFLTHVVSPTNNERTIDITNRGHNDYSKLSNSEKSTFFNDMSRSMLHMQNVMQLHQNGLLDEVDYRAWMTYAASTITSPGGKECWSVLKLSLTPTLVQEIDEFVAKNPSTPSFLDLDPARVIA